MTIKKGGSGASRLFCVGSAEQPDQKMNFPVICAILWSVAAAANAP
jgi:hypothetical protein